SGRERNQPAVDVGIQRRVIDLKSHSTRLKSDGVIRCGIALNLNVKARIEYPSRLMCDETLRLPAGSHETQAFGNQWRIQLPADPLARKCQAAAFLLQLNRTVQRQCSSLTTVIARQFQNQMLHLNIASSAKENAA